MQKRRIQTWFIKYLVNNKLIDEDEKELCLYGFEILSIYITIGICVTAWAMYFKTLYETVFFLVNFWIIRMNAGGLHLKSKSKCMFVSIIVFGSAPILLNNINCSSMGILLICFILLCYLTYKVCPIVSSKKALDMDQRKIIKGDLYKTLSLIVCEIGILYILKFTWLINIIIGSLILNIINILLGFYLNE